MVVNCLALTPRKRGVSLRLAQLAMFQDAARRGYTTVSGNGVHLSYGWSGEGITLGKSYYEASHRQ